MLRPISKVRVRVRLTFSQLHIACGVTKSSRNRKFRLLRQGFRRTMRLIKFVGESLVYVCVCADQLFPVSHTPGHDYRTAWNVGRVAHVWNWLHVSSLVWRSSRQIASHAHTASSPVGCQMPHIVRWKREIFPEWYRSVDTFSTKLKIPEYSIKLMFELLDEKRFV